MHPAGADAQAKESEVKWFHWLAVVPFKVAAIIIFAAMSLLKGARA